MDTRRQPSFKSPWVPGGTIDNDGDFSALIFLPCWPPKASVQKGIGSCEPNLLSLSILHQKHQGPYRIFPEGACEFADWPGEFVHCARRPASMLTSASVRLDSRQFIFKLRHSHLSSLNSVIQCRGIAHSHSRIGCHTQIHAPRSSSTTA